MDQKSKWSNVHLLHHLVNITLYQSIALSQILGVEDGKQVDCTKPLKIQNSNECWRITFYQLYSFPMITMAWMLITHPLQYIYNYLVSKSNMLFLFKKRKL